MILQIVKTRVSKLFACVVQTTFLYEDRVLIFNKAGLIDEMNRDENDDTVHVDINVARRRRCSIVAPLMQLMPLHDLDSLHFVLSSTVVTGLKLPRARLCKECQSVNDYTGACYPRCYHQGDNSEVNRNHSLLHPDYSNKATRLLSFKHWTGAVSAVEVAEAGFYMIAGPDVVRCYYCWLVVRDWKKGDIVIDIHCLRSPHCKYVKELINKIDNNDDVVCDGSAIINGHDYTEKPVIKGRVKTERQSNNINNHPVFNLVPGVPNHPTQRSVSTHGHVPKGSSSAKSDESFMYSPPREEIVLVSCYSPSRLCEIT